MITICKDLDGGEEKRYTGYSSSEARPWKSGESSSSGAGLEV